VRIAVALVLLVSIAHADDAIDRARQLEAKLAYDEALAIIDTEIRSGRAEPDRLVELHMIAGRLAAGLDKAKLAEDHFAIVIALRPSTTLPDDTSPKIAVPFTVARTKTKPFDPRAVIDAGQVKIDGGSPLVGIAVRHRVGTHEDTVVDRTQHVVARPLNSAILEVRALDEFGNTLWRETPPAPLEKPTRIDETTDPRNPFQRWYVWATLSGAGLVMGGIAAWRFDSAQNEFDNKRSDGMTDVRDLEAIERRGRKWALTANIAFGIAAASGITAVATFFLFPAPQNDGAVAGVAVRF
jgi:hypothetical protein